MKHSPAQQNYIEAKARFETIKTSIQAQLKEIYPNEPETRKIRSEYLDYKCIIEVECGYYKALKELQEAADKLIDWGYSRMRALPEYQADAEELEELRIALPNSPKAWETVIELTMQLGA